MSKNQLCALNKCFVLCENTQPWMVSAKWSDFIHFTVNEWIICFDRRNNSLWTVDKRPLWSQPAGLLSEAAGQQCVSVCVCVCVCVYSGLCGEKLSTDWNKDVKVNETMSWFPICCVRFHLALPLSPSVCLWAAERPVTTAPCCDYHANVFH